MLMYIKVWSAFVRKTSPLDETIVNGYITTFIGLNRLKDAF